MKKFLVTGLLAFTALAMKAQSDELQAKYEYLFRTKILDFYKGEPIE